MSSETRLREAAQDSLRQLRDQHAAALDSFVDTFIEAALAERDAEVAEARAETEATASQMFEQRLAKARAHAEADFAETRAKIAAEAQQTLAAAMAEADLKLTDALRAARENARAEADTAVAAALGAAREEAANARAEMDRAREEGARARTEAESTRIEAEQARADVDRAREEAAHARVEMDRARIETTNTRAEADRARAEAANALAEADKGLDSAVSGAGGSRAETDLAETSRLLDAIKSLDAARSLSAVFDTLADESAREANRAAVLLVRGGQICGWRFAGFGDGTPDPRSVQLGLDGAGVIVDAVRSGTTEIAGPEGAGFGFAPLPIGRAALAIPMEVGGRIVAVAYADDAAREAGTAPGTAEALEAPRAWPERVEVLARHAARCLEALTVMHGTRAQQGVAAGSAPPTVMGRMS